MKNRPHCLLFFGVALALPISVLARCGPPDVYGKAKGSQVEPATQPPTTQPPATRQGGAPPAPAQLPEPDPRDGSSDAPRQPEPGPCPSDHSPVVRSGFDSSGQPSWWHEDGSQTTLTWQEQVVDGVPRRQRVVAILRPR